MRRQYRRQPGYPVQLLRHHYFFHQGRVVVALHRINDISVYVFFRHIPGRAVAANAQALTLADGVAVSAFMLADGFSFKGFLSGPHEWVKID